MYILFEVNLLFTKNFSEKNAIIIINVIKTYVKAYSSPAGAMMYTRVFTYSIRIYLPVFEVPTEKHYDGRRSDQIWHFAVLYIILLWNWLFELDFGTEPARTVSPHASDRTSLARSEWDATKTDGSALFRYPLNLISYLGIDSKKHYCYKLKQTREKRRCLLFFLVYNYNQKVCHFFIIIMDDWCHDESNVLSLSL